MLDYLQYNLSCQANAVVLHQVCSINSPLDALSPPSTLLGIMRTLYVQCTHLFICTV